MSATKELHKKIFWLCLNALAIISLCLALIALFNKSSALNIKIQFNTFYLCTLIALQILVLLLSMHGWKIALHSFAKQSPGFLDNFIHTAFILAGKYIPGKIWGLLARGMAANKLGYSKHTLIQASICEQSIMLLSGGIFALFLTLAYFNPIAAALTAAGILPCIYYCSRHLLNALQWLLNKTGAIAKKIAQPVQHLETLSARNFAHLYLVYSLQWLCIAGTVLCITLLLNQQLSIHHALLISAAFIASVISGFLFLFSPGGIGIRESAFVLFASGFIGLESALNIALLHRAWITLYDCLAGLGGYGLFLLRNNNHSMPPQTQ